MRKILFLVSGILFAALLVVTSVPVTEPSAPTRPTDGQMPQITVPTQAHTEPAQTEPPVPETQAIPETTVPEEGLRLDELFLIVDREAPYNWELQHYLKEQVQLGENSIALTADFADGQYRSGKVVSKTAFRYGTFTFQLETTDKVGFFPAIWMLPASGEAYPEVDIYEAIGDDPNRFYGVAHYSGEEGDKDYWVRWIGDDMLKSTFVLRFEWTPEELSWYMDDVKIGSITQNCPDMPMYMIVNLALGGSWAGRPKLSSFPSTYTVEVLEFAPLEVYAR